MDRTTNILIAAGMIMLFMMLFVAARPYEKEQGGMAHQKQMIEMMQDSTMVNMMMDRIASDHNMRMTMMMKMIQQAKSDSSSMMEMCKMIMQDQNMKSMMMNMREGRGMQQEMKKDEKDMNGHGEHHKMKN